MGQLKKIFVSILLIFILITTIISSNIPTKEELEKQRQEADEDLEKMRDDASNWLWDNLWYILVFIIVIVALHHLKKEKWI